MAGGAGALGEPSNQALSEAITQAYLGLGRYRQSGLPNVLNTTNAQGQVITQTAVTATKQACRPAGASAWHCNLRYTMRKHIATGSGTDAAAGLAMIMQGVSQAIMQGSDSVARQYNQSYNWSGVFEHANGKWTSKALQTALIDGARRAAVAADQAAQRARTAAASQPALRTPQQKCGYETVVIGKKQRVVPAPPGAGFMYYTEEEDVYGPRWVCH